MAGFVYNPAESIRQDFQQAGGAIANIFSQVIQQQKRDYDLAESTYANIEALKKDLNAFGMKSITEKANALRGHAAESILQNGKLDFNKLGQIRQAVSDIKDLKAGYDLAGKDFEKWMEYGYKNKENLDSWEQYYKGMLGKMSDENLVKNPRDLQLALSDNYTNSLNAQKMFDQAVLSIRPYQKGEYTIYDDKNNQMKVTGELPIGEKLDAKGNVIYPEPTVVKNADGTTSTVTNTQMLISQLDKMNPDLIPTLMKKAGQAGSLMSKEGVVDFFYGNIKRNKGAIETKSASSLKTEEAQADISETKAKFAPQQEKADISSKKANAEASRASARYTNIKADNEEIEMNYDPFADFTKVSILGAGTKKPINLTKYPIGKDVSLNVNGQQGVIKSVARDEDGGVWVEAWQNSRNQITTKIDKNDKRAGFKWRKVSNLEEFNTELSQEINVGTGIPSKQKAKIRKAVGTLYNLPTRQSNIISAAPKTAAPSNTKTSVPGGAIPASQF